MLAILQNSALGLGVQQGRAAKQLALLLLARAGATRQTPVSDYADHTKKTTQYCWWLKTVLGYLYKDTGMKE